MKKFSINWFSLIPCSFHYLTNLFIILGIQSGKSPLTPHLNLPPNSGSGLPKLDKLQRYTWEVLAHYLGEINSNQDVQPIKYQIGEIQIN